MNVAVGFDFWVKSNEMARDGDEGLEGWRTGVAMVGDDGPMPLDMAPDATDEDGKSSFAYAITDPANMLPATFAVAVAEVAAAPCVRYLVSDQPDQCEMWEQSAPLVHTHTGLELPPGADDDPIDLGPIRITYTTQALYVGAHRELDDRTGYTDYIGIGDGDARPMGSGVDEIEVSLMVPDDRGRLVPFEYDDDMDDETDDVEATMTVGSSGMVVFRHIPADTEVTVVADAGNDMMIVPDDRASMEIDAFGGQLDDYPDGKIVGAFGEGDSGARADVWLCPLWRLDHENPNDNCSTFAYKWATGTISGTITNLREDDDATISLTPVNSNDDYEDDLADDMEVTAGANGVAEYSFMGVADGRYMVTLEANEGSWTEKESDVLSVMHDEDNDEEDYTGDSATADLSATDLRGVIRGRIANNYNMRPGVTSGESRAGVMVNLHAASAPIRSGINRGRRTAGSSVLATAETDGDGVFMFEGLQVGKFYFLRTVDTDLYTAVRSGDFSMPNQRSTHTVTHALARAALPPAEGTEPAIPEWDYHTSTATGLGSTDTDGAHNFVLLYKDAEVDGAVSDPSLRAAHSRSVVELHLCRTTDQELDADGNVTTAATGCDDFEGTVAEADVDDDGNWDVDGIREGIYEVLVDLPAGYVNVSATGTETTTDAGFFSRQLVTLTGARADAATEMFHIKDRNAGSESALTSVTVDAATCGTTGFDATSNTSNQCGHDMAGSFAVVVTASTGAVVRLSNLGDDDDVSTSSMRSFRVNNGRTSIVTLDDPGSEAFFVHVRSEDGYQTNGSAGLNNASTNGFTLRRNADVRAGMVTIRWSGGIIELDRRELGLHPGNPDGETGDLQGLTTIRVTVTGADGTDADVPITALTVEAASVTTGFGVVTWEDYVATETTHCDGGITGTAGDITVPNSTSSVVGRDGVCFRITDSDGDATNVDANTANTRDYLLIVTRGRNAS